MNALTKLVCRCHALIAFLFFGSVGVLIDIDHVLVLIYKGVEINMVNLTTQAGRPLHWLAVYVSGAIFLIYCAQFLGLVFSIWFQRVEYDRRAQVLESGTGLEED